MLDNINEHIIEQNISIILLILGFKPVSNLVLTEGNASYLSVYSVKYTIQLRSITIQHAVYILSLPTYTCPRTIRRYVAKSQGRRWHVGWHRSGRKRRFHKFHSNFISFQQTITL